MPDRGARTRWAYAGSPDAAYALLATRVDEFEVLGLDQRGG